MGFPPVTAMVAPSFRLGCSLVGTYPNAATCKANTEKKRLLFPIIFSPEQRWPCAADVVFSAGGDAVSGLRHRALLYSI
jgi:hypothetical protein